jgi:stage II sporulation protein D
VDRSYHLSRIFGFLTALMLHRSLSISKQIGGLSVLMWLATIASAQAYQIRVAVTQQLQDVRIGSSTTAIVTDDSGRKLGEIQPQKGLVARSSNNRVAIGDTQLDRLWVKPQNNGYVWINDRWYRGAVEVIPTNNRLLAINHVDLEQYLYSVLGAEMGGHFPTEALKAQAVAARSYAIYKSQSTRNQPFDVDNTQNSQVYKGLAAETNTTQTAVQATRGQVMTYGGKIILAVFHAASGGHTENVEDIWSSPLPYLRGVPDYDRGTPGYAWTANFTAQELGKSLGVNNIKQLVPDRLSPFGSVLSLKAIGDKSEKIIPGPKVRSLLKLRSLRYKITPNADGFVFNGLGYGHALGLSQWGAYNLAQQGMKYPAILAHYYRGATLAEIQENNRDRASN